MKTYNFIKSLFSSPSFLTFLLIINIIIHGLYFNLESVDIPHATKKLIVDTLKDRLVVESGKGGKIEVKNLENVVDEISYASQLGRLDLVSLILAIFGLILGFGAIYGFMHIKESSERVAEKATLEFLEKWSEGKDKKELSEDKKEVRQKNGKKDPRSIAKKQDEELELIRESARKFAENLVKNKDKE